MEQNSAGTVGYSVMDLLEMMRFRRPHGSAGERRFIEKFLAPLNMAEDEYGNFHTTVLNGNPDAPPSRTLFSTHVDTVHRDDAMQTVVYDAEMNVAYKVDGTPLGADNAAGMWVLMNMIKAGVPGAYVFHRGEECGGKGSGWLLENCAEWMEGFDRAIAFDRKSTGSVITEMCVGRTCSDKFAGALCDALNAQGLDYDLDPTGSFTDTANYRDVVAECTNVSVGYDHEHTKDEVLDIEHLEALLAACLKIDWEALPVERDPKFVEPRESWGASFKEDEGYYECPPYFVMLAWVRKHPQAAADLLCEAMERGSVWPEEGEGLEAMWIEHEKDEIKRLAADKAAAAGARKYNPALAEADWLDMLEEENAEALRRHAAEERCSGQELLEFLP